VTVRTYDSPAAFKEALEHRLRARTPRGAIVARTRQLLVFERFLARVVAVFGDAATIKGGVALELRIDRARTTKDVDLRLMGPSDNVLARLQQAARLDLGDFLTFEIAPDAHHPAIEADGMKYDGLRFRAECSLAGKIYGQRFGVDVAFGDPIFGKRATTQPCASCRPPRRSDCAYLTGSRGRTASGQRPRTETTSLFPDGPGRTG
jgi:hypothetical protein